MRHATLPTTVAAALLLPLALAPAGATEQTLTLDPVRSKIEIRLGATGHDVDGTFALRGGSLRFDAATGAANGEVIADLATGTTGNGSRDATMKDDVLETARFPVATLRAARLSGSLAGTGSSQVTLEGTLSVHGVDHPVSIPARVAIDGTHLAATAEFPVPFTSWGMKDPSILFLRVDKIVQVKLTIDGQLTTTP